MGKSFTFRVEAREMADVVSRVTRLDKRHVEVLNGVHLTLDGKELVAQATDMSLVLRERIPVTHAGEGARVVLKADKLLKGLKTLEGTITFAGSKDGLAIRNGTTTLNYAFGKIEDYPALPEGMGGGSEITCPRREFELTLGTIKAAISKDQSRPVLCTVLLEMDEGRVRMTATDSYRLASDSCSSAGGDFEGGMIDGGNFGKALAFVSQGIPPSKNGEITLSRFDRWVVLSANERSAWLRVVDGQFPNYRQLIPEAWEGCIQLDRRAALKTFDRMAKLNEGNFPARIGLDADDSVIVRLRDPDRPTDLVTSKIDAKIKGPYEPGMEYGVNPAFMHDALNAIGADEARLHYINPMRPMILTELDWDHLRGGMPDRFYLVMPVRLKK